MRFKKLELLGFKSFADQTELLFEPGVTAIVGPNGCGKSNIADAIKWVLGEQSAKELRGGRMEDLIFNGSDRREPINYAEVSLTLDNSDNKLPIEFSEVTISRRLFRTGESVYFLNKAPVRLKEISALLTGTGIGASAYSLFEQGKIDQVISARPEDRRTIFEEAAGITKFKAQKREAMRRLEETETNLSRISDIVREVKRQLSAMERQVKKAKVYREKHEELKKMEVSVAQYKASTLNGRWQSQEDQLSSLRNELKSFDQELSTQEERLGQLRASVNQTDETLHQTREALMKVRHMQQNGQASLQMAQDRIQESRNRQTRTQEELTRAQTQVTQVQEQHQRLTAQVEQEQLQRTTVQEKIQLMETQLEEFAQKSSEAEETITQTQAEVMEQTSVQVQLKNQLNKVRQESARMEARESRLKMEGEKVAAEKEEAAAQVGAQEEALAQARSTAEATQQEVEACALRLGSTESEMIQARDAVYQLEQEMTKLTSQLDLLKGLLASHEGYSSGVKGLLSAMDEGKLSREGVIGVLAELLHISPGEVAAVDAALGVWSEAMVVETAETAERIRQYLEEENAGRVLFLILERLELISSAVSEGEKPGWVSCPLVLSSGETGEKAVPLVQRIGVTPHLENLLQFLLSDTWLVSTREMAQEELKRFQSESNVSSTPVSAIRLVTPGGELLRRESSLLGPKPAEEGLLVGRVSRLESLEVAYAQTAKQMEEIQTRFQAARTEHQKLEQEFGTLERRLQEETQEIRILSGAVNTAKTACSKFEQEQELLKVEQMEAAQELTQIRVQLAQEERDLQAKNEALEQLQETIGQAQETIAEAGRNREETSVQLATARSELASFEEVTASRRASLQTLNSALENGQSQMTARQREMEELKAEQVKQQAASQELQVSLSQSAAEETAAAEAVEEAQRQKSAALEAAQEQETRWQGLNQKAERTRSKVHQEEMKQAQLSFEKEQIDTRLMERYEVRLEGYSDPTIPIENDEGLQEIAAQLEELDERLKKMGPVNLASIDEERELTQRYEHLTGQQEDLEKAKSDLYSVIGKINRTTRTMFRETFEAIQKEFRSSFKQLFRGGEARLVLTDEEDVLESGVEIIARPPGKHLQAISLLSGGEKAMTSIALLFAIFRVKPSPFCLLDEIDAPLDEANVDRFTGALREFLKDSQFIVVTHNKKTISMSDIMYGITMAESGVSRIVSVKLKKHQNGNGNGDEPEEAQAKTAS